MNTFITVMGWLCLAFALLCLLFGAVGLAATDVDQWREEWRKRITAAKPENNSNG